MHETAPWGYCWCQLFRNGHPHHQVHESHECVPAAPPRSHVERLKPLCHVMSAPQLDCLGLRAELDNPAKGYRFSPMPRHYTKRLPFRPIHRTAVQPATQWVLGFNLLLELWDQQPANLCCHRIVVCECVDVLQREEPHSAGHTDESPQRSKALFDSISSIARCSSGQSCRRHGVVLTRRGR